MAAESSWGWDFSQSREASVIFAMISWISSVIWETLVDFWRRVGAGVVKMSFAVIWLLYHIVTLTHLRKTAIFAKFFAHNNQKYNTCS